MTNADSHSSSPKSNRSDIFLLLLLICSLTLNVYLGWRIRQAGSSSRLQDIARIAPGTKVKPLPVVGLDGQPQLISYAEAGKPTVLYVIAPSCIWCERNQANIDRLSQFKENDFRFVGLSLGITGLKEYLERQRFRFPVYTVLDSDTIRVIGLGSTPQTIVISPDGEVLKNWTGAYREQSQREMEEYFQVSLPGLVSVNQ